MSHRAGRHQRQPSQSVFLNFGNLPSPLTVDNNAGANPAPVAPAGLPATPRPALLPTPHAALPIAVQPPRPSPAPVPAPVPKPTAPKENAAGDGAKAKDLAE